MRKKHAVPDAPIDHAANLRERLGRAAYAAMPVEPGDIAWDDISESGREMWRRVGDAVMHVIVVPGAQRGEFAVSSIYGYTTRKPYVNVEVSSSPMQVSPAKAREMALMLLESADASESDAALLGYVRDVLDLDEVGAAQLLNQFRAYRERQRGTEAQSA